MSKDHTPGGFHRTVDYRSDLEIAETGPMVKSVNTSFGGRSHNAYIMRRDGTHEHFFYSPETGKSGWHGNNWETKNNHPPKPTETETKENDTMSKDDFRESIKADKTTIEKCNEAGRKAANNTGGNNGSVSGDDGGRERGDDGPGTQGREPGNKPNPAPPKDNGNGKKGDDNTDAKDSAAVKSNTDGKSGSSEGKSGSSGGKSGSTGGKGSTGGHGGGGHGGHGGHGGGHGGH